MKKNFCKDLLFGVAVGDAIGVPYEFKSRMLMKRNLAVDMVGYGSHNLAPGNWSDDVHVVHDQIDDVHDQIEEIKNKKKNHLNKIA